VSGQPVAADGVGLGGNGDLKINNLLFGVALPE
jgi:hypothetical protein